MLNLRGRRAGFPRPARSSTKARPSRDGGLGKQFIPFWAGVVCSDLADGEFRTVIPLLTLAITRSPFAVSAVGLAARLPWLLVALPAGVIVDRHSPRPVMRWAAFSRLPLVVLAALLAVVHVLPVWGLAVIAFTVSAGGTFVDVSSQSMLPRLVPPGDLRGANQRLQSTQRLASQLIGPVIGGYAAALGSSWGLGAAAVMYLIVVIAFTRLPALIKEPSPVSPAATATAEAGASERVPPPGQAKGEAEASAAGPDGRSGPVSAPAGSGRMRTVRATLTELREGGAYFRHRPDLSRLAAIAGLINLAYAMCLTILPVWAVAPGRLGLSRGDYGLLLGSIAIGGVGASVFARPVLAWLGDRTVLKWGGVVLGASYFILAVPNAPLVCLSLIFGGAIAMLWNLTVVSYRQTTIAREVFGRVVAVYRWVTYGVLPLGSLLAGIVAGLAGTVWVFIAAGTITLAGALTLGLRQLTLAGAPAGPAATRRS
jgi:hypothetical protein